jgi:pimeloyl-ACP methyl ester carboxylesterase
MAGVSAMHGEKHDELAAKYEYPSSRYMSVGGKRIHYCVEGRGPTLVLLHGIMTSLHTWDGWVQYLAPHYRIVRIDLPGFGLSDHLASDDYTPEHAIELVEQVRGRLHLDRFFLAGNSLGGFFSWYYAAHHPEHVEKLILIDPIGYPQKLPSIISLLSLPVLGELAGYLSPRFLVDRSVRLAYGDPNLISEALIDRYYALLLHGKNRSAMVRTFRQLRGHRNDPTVCRDIQRVRAQTLLMWGECDRWVPPSLIEAWRRDLPKAQVKIYPGVGHLPMEELPELTAWDAHEFLSAGNRAWDDSALGDPLPVAPYQYARGA